MGKNILWVVALGVAAGIALPLVVLHSDDIEALVVKPQAPPPPDVVVKSWVVRDQTMVAEKHVARPAEPVDEPSTPIVHSRRYWNGPSYRPRVRARRPHAVRRRLDPAVRHTIESQDIAAWRQADQMLRIERSGGE